MRRALLLLCLPLVGCGAAAAADTPRRPPPAARVLLEGGVTVPVPAGWHLATRVTDLVQPEERFTLSSSAPVRGDQDSCGPMAAVRALGTRQVLAFAFEYGAPFQRASFPPRPAHLRIAGTPQAFECFGTGWLLRFREHDRAFQVMVALGRGARGTRAERRLLHALDQVVIAPREGA